MPEGYTSRGFAIYLDETMNRNGDIFSLHKSSIANYDEVWLSTANAGNYNSVALNQELATKLRDALNEFLARDQPWGQ